MKDIKLDANGDLDLTTGDFVIIDEAKQPIEVRLKWFQGEWPINPGYGVPYYDDVLGQKIGSGVIEQDIYDVLYDVPDVREVNYVKLERLPNRTLRITFKVTCENGEESGEVAV